MNLTKSSAAALAKVRKLSQRNEQKYRIEGEFLSVAEIGDRLGVTESCARSRLAKLRQASGPITLARLAGGAA